MGIQFIVNVQIKWSESLLEEISEVNLSQSLKKIDEDIDCKYVRYLQFRLFFIFVYFLFSSGMESQDITYNDYMDTFKFAYMKQRHNIITENKHG